MPAKTPRPVRTPAILQMEALDCGPAVLAIVLAHHGRWEPLETLGSACGASRSGSTAANVLRAARAYGLEAKGLRGGACASTTPRWGAGTFPPPSWTSR
jgi:ABC-type bacteriocin/lantibiotic exporter with double-glycine peptidase domain